MVLQLFLYLYFITSPTLLYHNSNANVTFFLRAKRRFIPQSNSQTNGRNGQNDCFKHERWQNWENRL